MPVLLKPHTKLRNVEGLRQVMNSTIGLRRSAKLMGDGVRSVCVTPASAAIDGMPKSSRS